MEMMCPECLGPLAVRVSMARCTLHGGTYRVLFARPTMEAVAAPMAPAAGAAAAPPGAGVRPLVAQAPGPPPAAAAPAQTCARHPTAQAAAICADCQSSMCATCAFPQEDGSVLCPNCATGRASYGGLGLGRGISPPRPAVPAGTMCAVHPENAAVQRCATCRTTMCETCDFALPGNLHLCANCATTAGDTVSGKRKKAVFWSYALALVSTLGIVVSVIVGAVAKQPEAFGVIFMLLGFLPAAAGTGVGLSAIERRMKNPLWVWVPAVWNGLMLTIFVLLSVVGTFMG